MHFVRIAGRDALLPEVHLKLVQQAGYQPRHSVLLGLNLKQQTTPYLLGLKNELGDTLNTQSGAYFRSEPHLAV